MLAKLKNIGPGALVAAAFVGPGTVTTCTLAGANFGYALLWALVFSCGAAMVLQEMSARIGVVKGMGLGDALHQVFAHSTWKWPLFGLTTVAILIGNAAYEAGNLSGAALGIEAVSSGAPIIYRAAVLLISLIAAALLCFGRYRLIEKVLVALVCFMAAAFAITFFMVQPSLGMLAQGLVPKVPQGSLMTVIALIGTTVVPYNLFLHAAAVKNRWQGESQLNKARTDTVVAIGLGGLISIFIVCTAAAAAFSQGLQIVNGADLAQQLQPLFGSYARYILGMGLFAAGLSSAITAPLATAYTMVEIFKLPGGTHSLYFRTVALLVIFCGASLAITGIKPLTIILLAQFANGLLLPVVVGFLLVVMNKRKFLGKYVNSTFANILGGAVFFVVLGLGLRSIFKVLGAF